MKGSESLQESGGRNKDPLRVSLRKQSNWQTLQAPPGASWEKPLIGAEQATS